MPWSTAVGRLTKIGAAMAAPTMEPIRNGNMVGHRMNRQSIMARLDPTPNCTTVCTGMRTAGGITMAISASRMGPPPAPVIMPKKAVQKDASAKPAKTRPSILGMPRNCVSIQWFPSIGLKPRPGPAAGACDGLSSLDQGPWPSAAAFRRAPINLIPFGQMVL